MALFINYDGRIVPAGENILTASNRAFRYGDGLFESMRLMKGELKFAALHAERLQQGMDLLKMERSFDPSADFLQRHASDLARKNRGAYNSRIRLTVFRNGEGLYSPESNTAGYLLEASPLPDAEYLYQSPGLIVDVFDEVPKPVHVLSNLKTCNALPYVMAGIFKRKRSLDEVLILNQHGFLCEALSCNVFVVYNKQIYTPSLAEGCIAGVMRRVIIGIAEQNGFKVIEAQINPDILHAADEVFLTNAMKGVQWVMGYNSKRYFNEISRFLQEKLNRL